MTDAELQAEWRYRYQERLGTLCGAGDPTPEQRALAVKEANAAIRQLSESGKP